MAVPDDYPMTEREREFIREEAMDFAGIGLFRYRYDGTLTFIDKGALRIFDALDMFPDPEAAVGRNIADVIMHTGPVGRLREMIKERGQVRSQEYEFRTHKGHRRVVLFDAFLLLYPETNEEILQVMMKDITEHKEDEETLLAEMELEQKYLQIAGVMFVAIDADERITMMNDKGCEILGYTQREVLGRNWFDLVIPANRREQIREVYHNLVLGNIEPMEYFENTVVTKRGDERLIAWHNTVVTDSHGRITGTLSSGEDITERKRAENRIAHLNSVLKAIRNVNQLITMEKDRDRLIAGVCEKLTESRGYTRAWVLLFDGQGGLAASAASGGGEAFDRMVAGIEGGDRPHCVRESMDRKGVLVIEDMAAECDDCPLAGKQDGGSSLSARLEHEGTVFGLINVIIPSELARDHEEHGLLMEVAGDLSFALFSMGVVREREEAKETVRESEAKYRALVEQSLMGIVIAKGPPIRWVFVNTAMADMLGYTVDELMSMDEAGIGSLVHPLDRDRFMPRFKKRIGGSGKPPRNYDFRAIHRDGSEIWLEISSNRIEYDGEPAIQAVFTDVTDRMDAQEAVRESEERYRRLVEMSPDAIVVHRDGRLVYINEAGVKMIGADSPEDVLGRSVMDFVHPEFKDVAMKRIQRMVQDRNEVPMLEETFIKLDGTPFDVEVVGIPFISGGKPAVQLVVRDITERKRTEDALKTSESNYRAIFDNASDAFFVIDMHTKQTLDVNRTTCEMFGYERDRMLDLEIGDFSAGWEPFTQRDGLRWLRKAEEGEAQIFEWLAKDKGGRLFWVEVNIKRAEVGGEKTLLGIVRHITERKKAEQQIIEQRNRAELYLDILSHDITNLNQAVMAYGEMLQIGDHPADKYKRFARNSWQQANAISDLISNVHKLSRLQGGDFSVRTVDAARYLESAVEKLMTANPGRNIKIDQDVSGTPLEVHGNEYLEDVFKNIMSHAVRQDLSNDVELRIKHSPSDEGKFLRLDFEDMGPGLSDEMKENIFRRLEAGDDGIEGTSFGLTFVREALTRCGGLVWVEDREKGRPEAGSRFVVLLPRG